MAYSEKDWAVVKAFYEQGLSLAEIVNRKEVKATGIKDRASISRKAKQEGWIKGKIQHLATEEIKINQALEELNAKKQQELNATELAVHNTLVDERLRDEKFFRAGHILVASTAIKKLKNDRENASYLEVSQAGAAIARAHEKVLGKEPNTVINNTNTANAVNQSLTLATVPPEMIRQAEYYQELDNEY